MRGTTRQSAPRGVKLGHSFCQTLLTALLCSAVSCRTGQQRWKEPLLSPWDMVETKDGKARPAAEALLAILRQAAYANYSSVLLDSYIEDGDFVSILTFSDGVIGGISMLQASSNQWRVVTLQLQKLRKPDPKIQSTSVSEECADMIFDRLEQWGWRKWSAFQEIETGQTCPVHWFVVVGRSETTRFCSVSGKPPSEYWHLLCALVDCAGSEGYYGSLPVPAAPGD